jgi:glycosyltransferase involved in cell wall biosynthesis
LNISFLVSYNPYAGEGASANRWRSMLEGLSANGANVRVLIMGGWLSQSEYETYGRTGFVVGQKNLEYVYVNEQKNFDIWRSRLNSYVFDELFSRWQSRKLQKIVNQKGCDALFLQPHLSVFRLFRHLSSRYLDGVRVVMEINEFNDAAIEHATNFLQRRNVAKFNQLLFKDVLPKLDVLFVMTKTLMAHFRSLKIEGLTIHHLPMTVDIDRFSDVSRDVVYSKPYIAYCGSSSFKKDGIDILIRSFEQIADSFPDLSLFIAAYFENDGNRMLELINSSKYSQRIIYLGTIHRDEIPAFISNAKLCVLPRPNSRQAEGGFPTKLGEYLSSGRPVCITTVGEIPDYLQDMESAFFAEPGSSDSFAVAMAKALTEPSLADRVGLTGKKVAVNVFNKDIQGKNLFNYLSKLTKDAE